MKKNKPTPPTRIPVPIEDGQHLVDSLASIFNNTGAVFIMKDGYPQVLSPRELSLHVSVAQNIVTEWQALRNEKEKSRKKKNGSQANS